MVNFKALALLVLLTGGIVFWGLDSLSGSGSDVQASNPIAEQAPAVMEIRPEPAAAADLSGSHLPLMVRWSNWRPEFGSAFVYAREGDLNGMLTLSAPVEKMLMVASYAEVERLMGQAGQLKEAGVTILGFNSENGQGMTPADEMQTLNSGDPNVNVVARSAKLASENGFKVIWGPVRNMVDSVSDQAILAMMASGVTGLAIQEQKFIENQPAQARLAAVNQTRERYLRLAQQANVHEFTFHVQIMQERCPDLANCVSFVEGLEKIPVDSIAIWSNGPIPPDFVSAIRME